MSRLTIRPYTRPDADAIARLLVPLGYAEASGAQVHARISQLQPDDYNIILVAEMDSNMCGWTHVCRMPSIVVEPYAEVRALIVDPAQHRQGIGRQLMLAAESWARDTLGVARLRLSSNISRSAAHQFYASLGYANSKTSCVFEKTLALAHLAKGDLCTTRS